MDVQLKEVSVGEKEILRNLLEKYDYEFSQWDLRDVNALGLYGYDWLDCYWTEENRFPYFILVDGKLAGFVMICDYPEVEEEKTDFTMAEFFVMYKYRKRGVGTIAARQAFDLHKGRWGLKRHPHNLPSVYFWNKVISDYTNGNYRLVEGYPGTDYDDGTPGDVFFFLSKNRTTEHDSFYSEFVGTEHATERNEVQLCICEERDKPLCKHYLYQGLITDYQGKRVVSVSKDMNCALVNRLCELASKTSLEECYSKLAGEDTGYRLSYMYRMFQPAGAELNSNEIKEVDGIHFEYHGEWRKQFAIRDGEPVGYAKISDLYGEYGNISVWVDEAERNKGLATILIAYLLQQCKIDGMIPIYLVMRTNEPSIRLARHFGFEPVQEEIILCKQV